MMNREVNRQQHFKSESTRVHNLNYIDDVIEETIYNNEHDHLSSPSSTSSSSSYTLSSPTSPTSPSSNLYYNIPRSPIIKNKNSQSKQAKLLNNLSPIITYQKLSKSLKSQHSNPCLSKLKNNKKIDKKKKTIKNNKKRRKHQRFHTESKVVSMTNKKTKKKKKNNLKKHFYSAKKHLTLQKTSHSERNSKGIKSKTNYFYYSNPNDLYAEKPLSRRRNNNKKKTKTNTKKKKKRMKKRPLSSRMSDQSKTENVNDDVFEFMNNEMNNDQMQYVQYDIDDHNRHEDEVNDYLVALKEDIECNMDNDNIQSLPLLKLSYSVSDTIKTKKCTKKVQKQNRKKSSKKKKGKNEIPIRTRSNSANGKQKKQKLTKRNTKNKQQNITSLTPSFSPRMNVSFEYLSKSQKVSIIDSSNVSISPRRNTIIGVETSKKSVKKKRMYTAFDGVHCNPLKIENNDSYGISLGALSDYFQYHANYETQSILSNLAGIIMQMVGEPNLFSIWFKVRPCVGMAIRRNKMRISHIANKGLVLSFCVHSMPQQFVNSNDESDDLSDTQSIDLICNKSLSPNLSDLPSSFDLTSDDDDNDEKDNDSMIYLDEDMQLSDDSNGTLRVREVSNYDDNDLYYSSSLASSSPSDSSSCASFGLMQSSTKQTVSPCQSPSAPMPILHSMNRSNSDIAIGAKQFENTFSNVELFRKERNNLFDTKSGSFSSFDIASNEIRSNMFIDDDASSFTITKHDKSFGSDLSASHTTFKSTKDEIISFCEDECPFVDAEMPQFGYSSSTNTFGSNGKRYIEEEDLSIFAKNVTVNVKMSEYGLKARKSNEIYEKSELTKTTKTKNKLKLSINASMNESIHLDTIQVTSPNNEHIQTLWTCDKLKQCLLPIKDTLNDDSKDEECTSPQTMQFPYYDDEKEQQQQQRPTLHRTKSQKKPCLAYSSRSNRTNSAKFAQKPALKSAITRKRRRHRPRAQTCTGMDDENKFFPDIGFMLGNEPDLYQSIVLDKVCSNDISMLSTEEYETNDIVQNIVKFQKPFNKMVADENGNIFIGTDKYIRYISYNAQMSECNDIKSSSKSAKYRKFRKQEKLLYELKGDEHLVSLWNQDGKIYFCTMPYAFNGDDNYHSNNNHKRRQQHIDEWSLCLYIVENNGDRQSSIYKHGWIPPSVRDKLPYRKIKTFRWKIKGQFVENFLSMWYDEKYQTLITLAECDRLCEPQLIFLNKCNEKGLHKQTIRKNAVSLYGSDDAHDDGVDHPLLIRHKPSKSWLCCISCADRQRVEDEAKQKNEECWIQFKINRELQRISSSKIIKLPKELTKKKWLSYDKYRDAMIGIKRLDIEELLELGFETKIELFVVPRLTKLIQQNATNYVFNGGGGKGKKKKKNKGSLVRKRSYSHNRK